MKELKTNIKKNILFGVIIGILVFPGIQKHTGIVHEIGLKGAIVPVAKPDFTMRGWFDASCQEKMETYLNESFGLRNYFVRINNQIAFTFFRKAKASGVIIGKEKYLYEENYIRAYYGLDFIGEDSILHRMQKLKYVQDTLEKINKQIFIVFAAGKGSFYPEYFPDNYKTKKGKTNYVCHVQCARKLGVKYIDFNNYFLEKKNSSPYPLYPKHGIHWSYYGSCLVADSIIRYIEKGMDYHFADVEWNKITVRKEKDVDYDIGRGMNLIFKLKREKMAYPQISFISDSTKTKPSIIVIADSFYWILYNMGISNAFAQNHFWYYNKEIYPESFSSPTETSQINLKEELDKHDVIVLLATEATLSGLGWGFIENTYNLFIY